MVAVAGQCDGLDAASGAQVKGGAHGGAWGDVEEGAPGTAHA